MTPKAQLLARVLIAHLMDGYHLPPEERREKSARLLELIEAMVETEAQHLVEKKS
jgi:hypothetical protein